ncbi:hypothetical protein GGR57DRAFT_451743, partial [Xylariaceae sp. FL1272]
MATSSADEELVRLRALLKREQSLRQDEQRRREEAERNQEEAERRREEAERRREEEQKKREEEQRRRESAEMRAEGSQLQTLQQYLEGCHSLLSLAIHVETDPSSTTQGDTTNPTGRVFPRRIIPWAHPFCYRAIFPSLHQLDYIVTTIEPIASENDLRHFARDTVEIAVQKLVGAAYRDDQLRAALNIQGSVTFESHTNLGGASVDASRNRATRKTRRGKSGPADQFCVYRKSDGRNVPALAIEYKAPHKLTRDEVVAGLLGEIQPERDWLVAAVVTQLFSYIGETFVFLRIPQDPSVVYYSVCVPNLDVMEDDEDRLHRTAALRSPPPPQDWHES